MRRSYLTDVEALHEIRAHAETRDVAGAAGCDIPFGRYLDRVLTVRDRVEDRLLRQTWWPALPPGRFEQMKLAWPDRPEKQRCVNVHGYIMAGLTFSRSADRVPPRADQTDT